MRGNVGLIKQLDLRIQKSRQTTAALENARSALVAAEPEVATRRPVGRPRKAAAAKRRGPGRPPGSKNKPREAVPSGNNGSVRKRGRPKGSGKKTVEPAIATPEAEQEQWATE